MPSPVPLPPKDDNDLQAVRDLFSQQTRILNRRPAQLDEISRKSANISIKHERYEWQEGGK